MGEGLTLNIIHSSLKGISKKDSHGNDPFWMRCSAIEQMDSIPTSFQPVVDIFSLVECKPFTYELYTLKTGYLLLKHNGSFYKYIFGDNFTDYDIEPYIKNNECWFYECEIKEDNFDEGFAQEENIN